VWVPDAEFSCYLFNFDTEVWYWRNAAAERHFSPFIPAQGEEQTTDLFPGPAKARPEKMLAIVQE
jgi:hypothetical protein